MTDMTSSLVASEFDFEVCYGPDHARECHGAEAPGWYIVSGDVSVIVEASACTTMASE